MQQSLRIAVLECDTPIGRTFEKYGSYGNLFKELLQTGAGKLSEKPQLDITKFDVVNTEHYPRLEDVDAILLSGSRESFLNFCGDSISAHWSGIGGQKS